MHTQPGTDALVLHLPLPEFLRTILGNDSNLSGAQFSEMLNRSLDAVTSRAMVMIHDRVPEPDLPRFKSLIEAEDYDRLATFLALRGLSHEAIYQEAELSYKQDVLAAVRGAAGH